MKTKVFQDIKTIELFGYKIFSEQLAKISFEKKLIINTINPHSFYKALKDPHFHAALNESDLLLPDGIGIVLANRILNKSKIKKIAGYDLLIHILETKKYENTRLFFLGSTSETLDKIKRRLENEYPNVEFCSFSPPFKNEFSAEDNLQMRKKINDFEPDVLFVGLSAPKQEKWTKENHEYLDARVICNIGAVFDFYAETIKRAPDFFINNGLEWLYRLSQSLRLLDRTLISLPVFLIYILIEFFKKPFYNIREIEKTEIKPNKLNKKIEKLEVTFPELNPSS